MFLLVKKWDDKKTEVNNHRRSPRIGEKQTKCQTALAWEARCASSIVSADAGIHVQVQSELVKVIKLHSGKQESRFLGNLLQ